MPKLKDDYNTFTGQDIRRTESLADGVFAIAMTILVLELNIPVLGTVHTNGIYGLCYCQLDPGYCFIL